jgi:hypothetical protein
VAEVDILDKNHCLHSTSGAYPSTDPAAPLVSFIRNRKGGKKITSTTATHLSDNVRVSYYDEQRLRTSYCNIEPSVIGQETKIEDLVILIMLYR